MIKYLVLLLCWGSQLSWAELQGPQSSPVTSSSSAGALGLMEAGSVVLGSALAGGQLAPHCRHRDFAVSLRMLFRAALSDLKDVWGLP